MTRHSHQDAVSEKVFEDLLVAADRLDEPFRTEVRFVLFAAGRLGLRAGEIAHLTEEWVNWSKSMIEIPLHDPCTKGRGGDICGYCAKRARSAAEHNDELTLAEAKRERWNPKTSNSARAIPFDFNDRIREGISEFFFHFDKYEHSRVSVNRRVDRVLREAGLDVETAYPHSLRASAASFHAYRGVDPTPLMYLMGWAKLSTANKYIRKSGEKTAEALRQSHS